jgi:predicted enzyme related to lactoylglutathione lyase
VHIFASVVVVRDLDRSLTFYRDVLGWEVRSDNQMGADYRFLCVAPPGHGAGIVLGLSEFYGMTLASPESPVRTNIYMTSDDVRADYERLVALGVSFMTEPELMPWGAWGATMVDPDGNAFFMSNQV